MSDEPEDPEIVRMRYQQIIDEQQRARGVLPSGGPSGIRVEDLFGTRPVGASEDSGGGGEKDSGGDDRAGTNGVVAALNNNRGPGPELEDTEDRADAVGSEISHEDRDRSLNRMAAIAAVAAAVAAVFLISMPALHRAEMKRRAAAAATSVPATPTVTTPTLLPVAQVLAQIPTPIPVVVTPPKVFLDSIAPGRKLLHLSAGSAMATDSVKPDGPGNARLYVRSVGKECVCFVTLEGRNPGSSSWMTVATIANPPEGKWLKYGGPLLAEMRFNVVSWASGDKVEADLCAGECPDHHEVDTRVRVPAP